MLVFANKTTHHHNQEDSILKYTPSQNLRSYHKKKRLSCTASKISWLHAIKGRNAMLQHVDGRFKNILTALAYPTFSNGVHAAHFPPFLTHCLKYFLPFQHFSS